MTYYIQISYKDLMQTEGSDVIFDRFHQSIVDAMCIADDPVLGTDDNISTLSRICKDCDDRLQTFLSSLDQEALQRLRVELASSTRAYAKYLKDFLPFIVLYRLLESSDHHSISDDEMRHASSSILGDSCESYQNPNDDGNLVPFVDGSSHHLLEFSQ